MKNLGNKYGFTSIEFFLSVVALFLLLIITYPILQNYIESSERNKIKENLTKIRDCADRYFKKHSADTVSLYKLIGPRREISELNVIADEEYPLAINRGKEISAFSKKYGILKVD